MIITVLADDITGAAEISGVCLRYGLSVTFDFDFNIQNLPSTDVWVIASDTRSLSEKEACEIVRKIARRLKALQVKTVFKKIDSALRGHIVPEIKTLIEYIPVTKVFILPANPETGRIIRDGIYLINEQPLHQTSFANDPDFPAKTSSVREILQLTENEIVTPDILNMNDYKKYAKLWGHIGAGHATKGRGQAPPLLPVGGSVFFEACLKIYFPSAKITEQKPICKGNNTLMICGSTHEASKQFIRENLTFKCLEIASGFVDELLDDPENLRVWTVGAIFNFKAHKKLIITVNNEDNIIVSSEKVKYLLSKITAEMVKKCDIDELLIEGGATAYACLQMANIASLIPVHEYSRGIVRLKIAGNDNMYITIKPGSYEWSPKLF